jgi:hypothetical protein
MNRCHEFDLEIAARGDAALAPHLARHAEDCSRCAAALAAERALDALLASDADVEPPADLAARILAAAEHARVESAVGRRQRLLRRVAAAALLAAAALVALRFAPESSSPTSSIARDQRDPHDQAGAPDPDLLANLDLLLDWELLDAHAEELDLLAAVELEAALGGEEGG